jgi:hypothetical protein
VIVALYPIANHFIAATVREEGEEVIEAQEREDLLELGESFHTAGAEPRGLIVLPTCDLLAINASFKIAFDLADEVVDRSPSHFRSLVLNGGAKKPYRCVCSVISKVEAALRSLCALENLYATWDPNNNVEFLGPTYDYILIENQEDSARYLPIKFKLRPIREIKLGRNKDRWVFELIVLNQVSKLVRVTRSWAPEDRTTTLGAELKVTDKSLVDTFTLSEMTPKTGLYFHFENTLLEAKRRLAPGGAQPDEVRAWLEAKRAKLANSAENLEGYPQGEILKKIIEAKKPLGAVIDETLATLRDAFVLTKKMTPRLESETSSLPMAKVSVQEARAA